MDRADLKSRAKNVLSATYWTAFGVSIVAAIIGARSGRPYLASFEEDIFPLQYSSTVSTLTGIVLVLGLAYLFFVSNPLSVGAGSFYSNNSEKPEKFATLFSSFKAGRYTSICKTMFITDMIIFLGSLLIIPGIIFSYKYFFVRYIIADDPALSPKQARDISSYMTDGHKFEIFVLGLSFLGWYLLGSLAFFIGVFFITPYYEATCAELYKDMKNSYLYAHRKTQQSY